MKPRIYSVILLSVLLFPCVFLSSCQRPSSQQAPHTLSELLDSLDADIRLGSLDEDARLAVMETLQQLPLSEIDAPLVDVLAAAASVLRFDGIRPALSGYPAISAAFTASEDALSVLTRDTRVVFGAMMAVGTHADATEKTESDLTVTYTNGRFVAADGASLSVVYDSSNDRYATNDYIKVENGERSFVKSMVYAADATADDYRDTGVIFRGFVSVFVGDRPYTLYVSGKDTRFGDTATLLSVATHYKDTVGGEYAENPLLDRVQRVASGALSPSGTLVLTQNASGETVYPYCDVVKDYFLDTSKNVGGVYAMESDSLIRAKYAALWSNYKNANNTEEPMVDITLAWECEDAVVSYTLTYAPSDAEDDAYSVTLDKDTLSYGLRNLYKGTTYVWTVEAALENGVTEAVRGSFYTTDVGPRVITIPDVYNVRDLGGYTSRSGATSRQGLLYRSAAFDRKVGDGREYCIEPEGLRAVWYTLGIATDLDLRSNSPVKEGILDAPLGDDVSFVCVGTSAYTGFFNVAYPENQDGDYVFVESEDGRSYTVNGETLTGSYRRLSELPVGTAFYGGLRFDRIVTSRTLKNVMQVVANEENYPIIFHCSGGADRGGSVAFALGALLGYSDETLIRDYEMTTFSGIGARDKNGTVDSSGGFYDLVEFLHDFDGDSLAEKVERLAKASGVTEEEIEAFRHIMGV